MAEKKPIKRKCSVYVRNSKFGPSDYYRIIQYIDKMNDIAEFQIHDALNERDFQKNLNLRQGWRKKIYQGYLYCKILWNRLIAIHMDYKERPDVIIIQREIFPKYMPLFLKNKLTCILKATIVIWDFDDDIFLNGEISKREKKLLCTFSRNIIGIGEYAKSLLPQKYQKKFLALPTTDCLLSKDDLNQARRIREDTYHKEIRMIWVGTASNLEFLDTVIEQFDTAADDLQKHGKKLILCVVCNLPYKKDVKSVCIENIKWSRENTRYEMMKAHIGIMPLANHQYVKGKGGFKLIQYLSSGIFAIASDIGFCREVIDDSCGYLIPFDHNNGWKKAIGFIGVHYDLWNEMCKNAYQKYISKFELEKNLLVWKKFIGNEI